MQVQFLNGLALFSNQIEPGCLRCAGRERYLERCRGSCYGLPLYAEQSFVTRTAAFLHKLGADEKNVALRLSLQPVPACASNLCAPFSRFRRSYCNNTAAI